MRGPLLLLFVCACSASPDVVPEDAGVDATDGAPASFDAAADAIGDGAACTTRVQYGAAFVAPANHPNDYDVFQGNVTWDGTCVDDGAGSYALLSNGQKVTFQGHSACILALDASCAASACATRVTYSGAPHDFTGRVFSDGACTNGAATLSNGDTAPCAMSFSYTQCGGLYTNPLATCADPGVLRDDDGTYVLSCTSGAAANAFPIYTSPDLAHWKLVGHVFPQGKHPSWTTGNAFWAPEIHKVGSHYVAYFSAEDKTTGLNQVGAASAPTATGPFTDIGHPLVSDPTIGCIDASEINTQANESYVIWKTAGLGVGKPTPIHSQKLTPDGLALVGSAVTLITNDQAWEGKSTEGPFMIERGGSFYLFYSGGIFTNATYAVGVARGTSPHAPMTKLGSPILTTNAAWVGPGHCSIVQTASDETAIVYGAWKSSCVAQSGCSRWLMLDTIAWHADGWPSVLLAPSSTTRPLP